MTIKVVAAACALTLTAAAAGFALNPQPLPPIVRQPTGIVSTPKTITTTKTSSGPKAHPKKPGNHH